MNDEQPVKADPSKFWALVELFGHSQVAGEVSEFVLGFITTTNVHFIYI